MKKKKINNYSGIVVCDSITMSVKRKKLNLSKLESLLIALIGFISVIMSFLKMFSFNYNLSAVIAASIIFSAVYISLAFAGKKAIWITASTFLIFIAAVYKFMDPIINGFKYIYNVIYCDSKHTAILYYKHLDPDDEFMCITTFLIFGIWLLSLVIYTFTIRKPNPLIVLAATFPIIEIGLYNGIKIPIFWGILTIGYWIALISIYTTDLGEYNGGNGGFVRKGNLFFPKRQMRLKVTEKCAVILIFVISAVTACTMAVMSLTGYKRSDALNQKRAEIKEAANSFTFDDVASSISSLTEAFGFSFSYETHKLGNLSHVKYKNITDMIVTFNRKFDGAVYLKGSSSAVYGKNEWTNLKDSAYKNEIFDEFKKSGIYPQDFPSLFSKDSSSECMDITMWIEAKRKKNKSYAPYGTKNYGDIIYDKDLTVSSNKDKSGDYSYKFIGIDSATAAAYLNDKSGMYTDVQRIESDYRDFVYDNYLQVPDNNAMNEVRDAFADILENAPYADSAKEKLEILETLRERVNSMSEYTLSPGETPSNRDFVNYFLLENHKGYCMHYATAGTILARMAGIPARYATGYIIVGDDFNDNTKNSDGTYTINVMDNRSHAWTEIYLDGFGWIPFEFTQGYSSSSIIDPSQINITTTTPDSTADPSKTVTATNKPHKKSGGSGSKASTTVTTTVTTTTTTTEIAETKGSLFTKISADNIIILAIPSVLIAAAFILLRRRIIIMLRHRHFTTGTNRSRTAYMYAYAEKLLAYLKINKGTMMYTEFADYVEQHLAAKYFNPGEFAEFMNTMLKCSFGEGNISDENIHSAHKFIHSLSRSIYCKSGKLKKLYIKFILALV